MEKDLNHEYLIRDNWASNKLCMQNSGGMILVAIQSSRDKSRDWFENEKMPRETKGR